MITKYLTALGLPLVALLTPQLSLGTEEATTHWRANGLTLELSVNGGDYEPFFAKGLGYSPTPIGDGGANSPPYNDYFYRNPDLPDNVKQYQKIWERDIGDSANPGLIRQMGVNSIRTYSMLRHLYTDEAHGYYDAENEKWVVPTIWPRARELDWSDDKPSLSEWYIHHGHDAFLDMCWNDGVDPIYVWICIPFDGIFFGHAPNEDARKDKDNQYYFFKKTTEWLARNYGNHPAVIGFILGNEHDGESSVARQIVGSGIVQTRVGELDFSDPDRLPAIPSGGWPPEVMAAVGGGILVRQGDSDVYTGIPEFGNTWRQTYWDKLNELHDIVKDHAPNKLTTTSLHDDPNILIHWIGEVDEEANTTTVLAESPREYSRLDVWSFNTYNIPGQPDNVFDRYEQAVFKYAQEINRPEIIRPLLLTELGVPASTRAEGKKAEYIDSPPIEMPNNAQEVGEQILSMWKSVADNRVGSQTAVHPVSSGAYIFAYTDEWWKHSNPRAQDGHGNYDGFFVGGYWDEEWFGLFAVEANPDRGQAPNSDPLPPHERDVINMANGDLNGAGDILRPRAAVELLTKVFKAPNPLRARAAPITGDGLIHELPWYGLFYDGQYPWVYHYGQGWQYVMGETAQSLFKYDQDVGWTYTSATLYPFLYLFSYHDWAYYDRESDGYILMNSGSFIPDEN